MQIALAFDECASILWERGGMVDTADLKSAGFGCRGSSPLAPIPSEKRAVIPGRQIGKVNRF